MAIHNPRSLEMRSSILRSMYRCAQSCDALWLPSVWSQSFHVLGDNAGMVPRLRFALVQLDACMSRKCLSQHFVEVLHARRWAEQIDVEKSTQLLSWFQ